MLTRMARLLTRMARMLTRMTRWLAGSHIIHTQNIPQANNFKITPKNCSVITID